MFGEFDVNTDSEVFAYIRNELSAGNTLSSYLLNQPIENGHVTTFLPVENAPSLIKRYATGITSLTESNHMLAYRMRAFLNHPGQYAILEDVCFDLDSPGADDCEEEFFSFQTEVYYFLTSRNQDIRSVINIINCPCPNPFVGVLVSTLVDEPSITNRGKVGRTLLKQLADHTIHLIIGAYDATGYLIWHRGK
jgi:hypothetical protein